MRYPTGNGALLDHDADLVAACCKIDRSRRFVDKGEPHADGTGALDELGASGYRLNRKIARVGDGIAREDQCREYQKASHESPFGASLGSS